MYDCKGRHSGGTWRSTFETPHTLDIFRFVVIWLKYLCNRSTLVNLIRTGTVYFFFIVETFSFYKLKSLVLNYQILFFGVKTKLHWGERDKATLFIIYRCFFYLHCFDQDLSNSNKMRSLPLRGKQSYHSKSRRIGTYCAHCICSQCGLTTNCRYHIDRYGSAFGPMDNYFL